MAQNMIHNKTHKCRQQKKPTEDKVALCTNPNPNPTYLKAKKDFIFYKRGNGYIQTIAKRRFLGV